MSAASVRRADAFPRTPDGRYFVGRGRLWRLSDPALDPTEREALVRELMAARRAVRDADGYRSATAEARARVDAAKRALGDASRFGGPTAPRTTTAAWRRTRLMPSGSRR